MEALQDLATYAASHRIRGRSYKRNSLLKPLDIILNELDRCPDTKNEDEINLIKAGTKGLILEHIQRVTKGVHEDTVYQYVEIFFEQVLKEAHHDNANRLLQRERLLRSAYLVYMREALAQVFIARGKAKTSDEAMQALHAAESQDRDEEETDQER
jgi:CRISPR-associated protein Csc3